MGIQHLTKLWHHYLVNTTFYSDGIYEIVIDGPALAYYIWTTNNLNVLSCQYKLFAEKLLQFVRSLEECGGFKMHLLLSISMLIAEN